jgi:hypothetical protein
MQSTYDKTGLLDILGKRCIFGEEAVSYDGIRPQYLETLRAPTRMYHLNAMFQSNLDDLVSC